MFEEVLVKNTKEHLALLSRSSVLKNAYLAGGTACALQLGHRLSIDFDFFITSDFDPKLVASELANISTFKVEEINKGTLLGTFLGTKFSLFKYHYPLIFPPLQYQSLNIADIRDIGAMKLDAIASRGTKRDFIDLYFICNANHELFELLAVYDKKYKILASNSMHIKKSLIYFDDAEADAMPTMLKDIKWQKVKKYFEDQVKILVTQNTK